MRADARGFLAAPRPERPLRAQNCYFPDSFRFRQMYYTQLSINCINFGSAHFRNTRPAATITAPCRAVRPYKDLQWNANISHHRRMRRWPVVSAAACFAIFLRGNCFRWERCLHAGGAVVQICRKNIVCWPQRSSTDSFCGLRYNPIRIQRLFLHTFSGKTGGTKLQTSKAFAIWRGRATERTRPAACGGARNVEFVRTNARGATVAVLPRQRKSGESGKTGRCAPARGGPHPQRSFVADGCARHRPLQNARQ